MSLRLVRQDTPERRWKTLCLRIFVECVRIARDTPELADWKYFAAYLWLAERVRIEMGGKV